MAIYDQYGSRVNTGLTNVQLTLKGGHSLYCDSNGYYFFDSVTTGSYFISAGGPGLAATVLYNVPLVKDTTYEEIKVSQLPAYNLNTIHASYTSPNAYDVLSVSYAMDTRVRNCIIFASNRPGVSNQPGHYSLVYVKSMPANSGNISFLVPAQDLNEAGIFFGDKVYYAAYSYVVNDMSVYNDAVTGDAIYNAVGIPVIDSALCP